MSQFLIAISTWLHAVATVVFIGHYLLLALITMPALESAPQEARGFIVSAISRRSRTWLYAALIVFALTGSHLTLVDPNYLGIGDFDNVWSVVMLVKHILILGMIVLGAWFNGLMRVGPLASSNTGGEAAIARFRSHANIMAAAGVVVLLLTALSQLQ